MTTGLFVGRFQPFHNGHLATVKFALAKVDELVILVGSAQKSHEHKNPFTAGERIRMIKNSLNSEKINVSRISIIPVPDVDVHSLWTAQVDMLVPKYEVVFTNDPFTMMLFREKGIKTIAAPLIDRSEVQATEIRRRIATGGKWESLVPAAVARMIKEINGIERIKTITERTHH